MKSSSSNSISSGTLFAGVADVTVGTVADCCCCDCVANGGEDAVADTGESTLMASG